MSFCDLTNDGQPRSRSFHFTADRPFEQIEDSLTVF
jgi:hypothetical protein